MGTDTVTEPLIPVADVVQTTGENTTQNVDVSSTTVSKRRGCSQRAKISRRRCCLAIVLLLLAFVSLVYYLLNSMGAFDKYDNDLPIINGTHVIEPNTGHVFPLEVSSLSEKSRVKSVGEEEDVESGPRRVYRLVGCSLKIHALPGESAVKVHIMTRAFYLDRSIARDRLRKFHRRRGVGGERNVRGSNDVAGNGEVEDTSQRTGTIERLTDEEYAEFLKVALPLYSVPKPSVSEPGGVLGHYITEHVLMHDVAHEFYKEWHKRMMEEWKVLGGDAMTSSRLDYLNDYFEKWYDRSYSKNDVFSMEYMSGEGHSMSLMNDKLGAGGECADAAMGLATMKITYEDAGRKSFNLFDSLFEEKYDRL